MPGFVPHLSGVVSNGFDRSMTASAELTMTMTSSSVSLRHRSALGQLLRSSQVLDPGPALESLAGLFGVEVAAFDVLSDDLHVILRIRLDVVALWSDQEVARRWLALFPGRVRSQTVRRWRRRGVFREHPVKFAVVSVRVPSGMLR